MLLSKTFANNKSTTYTYNPTGTLKSGTWARGITTTYTYDNFKQLLKTSYSDNTPVTTNTYFANGALKTVADNVGTTTFAYNQYGDKIKESVSGSYIKRVLSRNLDHFGRETSYSIGNSKKAEYSYNESDGRFKIMNAVNGGNFEFGYMENTSLQNRITYPNGMVKNTSFEEKRNLITGINYQNGANLISNYSYENDVLGRRTNIGTTYDNATKSNDYNYNPRSEVIGAHGDTLNQTFDYDNIGNRITSSNNDITTNYSTNNLNQYETVGDFVPLFDADGNQTKIKTTKGEFLVEYNGENRPIKFTNLSDSTFITMKYDYMGRRGGKLHFNSQGQWQSTVKFFYKDYTLIEESTASNEVLKEFVWDPTAGSATRPLFLRLPGQAVSLLYCHDANKNVTEVSYLATANGIGAHYEYDSFGNVITSSSNTRVTTVDLRTYNTFRFSSEYHDDELCLIYYNYRHYNPQSGRWISRDPIEEKGGYNLYGMCNNNVNNFIDILGLTLGECALGSYMIIDVYATVGPNVAGDADEKIDLLISTFEGIDKIIAMKELMEGETIDNLRNIWRDQLAELEQEKKKKYGKYKMSDEMKTFPPSFADLAELLDLINKAASTMSSHRWGFKIEGYVDYKECLCKKGKNDWGTTKTLKSKSVITDHSSEGTVRNGGFETWEKANANREVAIEKARDFFIREWERNKTSCKK